MDKSRVIYILITIGIMALVTYIPRVLPITIFRKTIRSKFVKSFLNYTPYAVLGAMTFPDIFYSTGSKASALAGAVTALILAYFKKSLVTVALSAIAVVYVVELLISL